MTKHQVKFFVINETIYISPVYYFKRVCGGNLTNGILTVGLHIYAVSEIHIYNNIY